VTLCVLRASAIVGGGMDHIRSAGWISGMKRVMTGSDATVKSTREDGRNNQSGRKSWTPGKCEEAGWDEESSRKPTDLTKR